LKINHVGVHAVRLQPETLRESSLGTLQALRAAKRRRLEVLELLAAGLLQRPRRPNDVLQINLLKA